jgi:hypothetical protein
MYKPSWRNTLGCSKHVEDTIIKLKQLCKKCAFCWFLLHRYLSAMLIIATLGLELGTGQSHWPAKRAAPVLYADCRLSICTPPLQLNLCNWTCVVQGLKLRGSDGTASTKNLSYRLECHTAPLQSATYIYNLQVSAAVRLGVTRS